MTDNRGYKWNSFRLLIQKALEGTLTDQEKESFQQSLLEDPEARKCYLDYMAVHGSLSLISGELADANDRKDFDQVCRAILNLSNYERVAPAVDIPVETVIAEHPAKAANKPKIMTIIMSVAALFIFLFSIMQVLINIESKPEVSAGIITDCLGARLVNKTEGQVLYAGSVFSAGEDRLLLDEGVVSLALDNNVEIVVESPAEFQILSQDAISLKYGKVYATVPSNAIGFAVHTESSTIIDLGTEFGVNASKYGNTELHVIKGKTSFVPTAGDKAPAVLVTKGQAKSSRKGMSQVSDIEFKQDLFVRSFSSEDNFLWKGQSTCDLADILNGGNGFGTGKTGTCIDPSTGKTGPASFMSSVSDENPWDDDTVSYISPVESIDAVDCVVVPCREGGDLPISTSGLVVPGFKELLGNLRWPIQVKTEADEYPFVLNGNTYGSLDSPAISIHANCGITFDLDEIRSKMDTVRLVSFQSLFGVNESRIENIINTDRSVEVFVFLDGEQVYNESVLHVKDNAVSIDISLEGSPKYLTLLVCCGEFGNDYDWGGFANPVITLARR